MSLYNLLNLFDRDRGQYRGTFGNNPSVPLLRLAGYDTSAGRGVYQLAPLVRNEVQDFESRWQAEIGVRYVF